MATLAGDLRAALRALRTHPAFTAVAVASLALGIGANTAIFSLVDQLLLWSVPAREPERLVRLEGGRTSTYPFYREYRDRNAVFSGLCASSDHPLAAGLRPDGAAAVEVGHVTFVSGNFFGTLGMGAAAGRGLAEADDAPGAPPAALLSYDYWQRRFSGSLDVLGRRLEVNGFPLVVVGVAERGFGGLAPTQHADAFLPLSAYPLTTPGAAPVWNKPGMYWLTPIARLKTGVTMQQAEASLRVLWPRVVDAVNQDTARNGGRPRRYDNDQAPTLAPAAHGAANGPANKMDPLVGLLFATGLVLLMACANVANLLLARASGRRREMAVRAALGATRLRLVRQLLTESLVLAGFGGVCGLALAYAAVLALAKANLVDSALRFHPSLPVATFCVATTLLTGILFGIAAALRASRGLAPEMRGSRLRLGKAIIALQVALSLALLASAGLFLRTLRNLVHADIGFQRENTVIVDIDPTKLGYQGHRLRTFYEDVLARARRAPGVRSTALSLTTPMSEFALSTSMAVEGYQPASGERMGVLANKVTEGYFSTLGIPILLGRDFTERDEPAVTPSDNLLASMGRMSGQVGEKASEVGRVCIISESLARQYFAGANPVGRHISLADRYNAADALEIVGVVKDVRTASVRRPDVRGLVYTPAWSGGAEMRLLSLRVGGESGPAVAALRRQLHSMDANVPVLSARPLAEYVDASFARERLIAWLCAVFGALALALAAVGLYGVMAYAVTQRTREIGVRMALGARRGDVIGMVLRDVALPVLGGIAAGVFVSLSVARLVAGMLYSVAPRDPMTLTIAAAVLLVVSLAAAAFPARRASRVEPMQALRHE
jgi:predicted permease